MGRDIKFRAWDNGQMHKVSFNNLWCNDNHSKGKLIIRTENKPFGEQYATELMQWTGLNDSVGKEIYEGDIYVIWYGTKKDRQNVVEFDCGHSLKNSLEEYGGSVEVIGNIYENPELLEVPK